MISALTTVLITLLIVGVIYWAVTAIIGLIPLPAPIGQIVHVILILILALIVIFTLLPLIPGAPNLSWR